ncbi:Pimeloyl-ACP methyl ester carboxylesterase [Bradyrhizobium lablabi]|uniref:Pimeloyl-ACP methyl ester carboxylesterase n=1 Tax=Bradyrhizobium lablabi TaxID=722472 RepID=A0A1M7AJW1_9BRAD|nr:alpha/beta hydrolase [Bradyrhizobium lablabi]SHL43072.1 Pimeloyl-ACP methyl ester carboxylesterase [Bradyrhizobium lablabi]
MPTKAPPSDHEYKYVVTEFGNIAYREAGSGPVAIFVHGVLLNGHLWDRLIEQLAGTRRCIAIDILAHGATRAGADQDLSFDAQANMLAAFCQAMKFDRVDVVANDSGGGIAQIFAARHPERIRSLVLTDCDAHDNWPPKQAEPLHRLAKAGGLGAIGQRMLEDVAFARTSFGTGFEHPEQLSPEDFKTWLEPLFDSPASVRNLERFITAFDNRQTVAVEPLLRKLEAPTLIVWGTADVFFPVKWAYWLRGAIPGAREVVELEGAKLFFSWERPVELATALRNFWR